MIAYNVYMVHVYMHKMCIGTGVQIQNVYVVQECMYKMFSVVMILHAVLFVSAC